MTTELGVWTHEDCASVLIDYQKEMFEVIRSETDAKLVELDVCLLAKTAKAFDMPIVLSTVGVEYGFNSPTLPGILGELEGAEPIGRSSMNAFEDAAFREAVEATGRKRLIIGGLHTEICLTFATVQALQDGYDAMFVTDAVGGRSQVAHRIAYVPFFPIGSPFTGGPKPLAQDPTISSVAAKHAATHAQIALAWLLHKDEHVLLIPGTSSVTHLEQNMTAARIALDDEDLAALDRVAARV